MELAQSVENDYIGSPCGNLDQVMILYARDGYGTHFVPSKGCSDKEPRRWNCDVHSVRWRHVLRSYYISTTNTFYNNKHRTVRRGTFVSLPSILEPIVRVLRRARTRYDPESAKQFTKMLGSDDAITKMRSGSAVKFLSDIDTSKLFDAVMKSIPRHMQIFAIVFDTSILQSKIQKTHESVVYG